MSTRTPADHRRHRAKATASRSSAAGMRITYLIGQLDRIVSRRLSEVLSQHGLTLAQYTALSVLRARGRASNARLAERSFITPQSANVVVKTMEANGWVRREHDPANRRIVLLSLTPTGEALLDDCNAKADRIERAMLAETGDEAAQSLQLLLHACVRNLRAA
ncbi:MarR family transcriptional regulator [Paraburkholderia sp. JHI869]|uniref:MarR family winged helix-turn-helix transcriptional regulator n=1 Tax=Paraburkholderia sp. JHI869 TaxID=3112959 RepID=UPI00316D35CA